MMKIHVGELAAYNTMFFMICTSSQPDTVGECIIFQSCTVQGRRYGARGKLGVDMSTPLLPEGTPEIDTHHAGPLSLGGRCGRGRDEG